MATTPGRSVGEAVESIERRFLDADLHFGHGSLEAFDEAAYIVLHKLGLPLDALDAHWGRPVTAEEQSRIDALAQARIATRKPIAYLTHEAWLGPHKFYVDERVLVPRSFIAELLQEALAPWVEDPLRVTRVLDVCTGSGCLAILAAIAFPNARVDGADLSADALAVARRNVADYGLQDRVRLVESDLFFALGGERYDVIVTNPPYVTGESMRTLPEEYLREPEMALASGEDGLDHTRAILAAARQHLTEDGLLVVEVGFNREGVERVFPNLPMTWLEVSAGDEVVFLVEARDLPA
ncbi:MAG: 50S ribosomal protein L3 N(5)-glutamine methyltransferase [Betaproteobacteria bacterium]|nr:50S ribosomal protein L3 N(5)-glutamine methyltransferase [Betaproteobacteria bacterium]